MEGLELGVLKRCFSILKYYFCLKIRKKIFYELFDILNLDALCLKSWPILYAIKIKSLRLLLNRNVQKYVL